MQVSIYLASRTYGHNADFNRGRNLENLEKTLEAQYNESISEPSSEKHEENIFHDILTLLKSTEKFALPNNSTHLCK